MARERKQQARTTRKTTSDAAKAKKSGPIAKKATLRRRARKVAAREPAATKAAPAKRRSDVGAGSQPKANRPTSRLEMPTLGGDLNRREIRIEDYADVSDGRASVLSVVIGLEEQVNTAFKLRQILQADLDATRRELAEASAARAELESRIKPIGAQATLVQRVGRAVSAAEAQRNKLAGALAKTELELQAATAERDALAENVCSAEDVAGRLETERMAREAQVMNTQDTVAEVEHLRSKLAKTTTDRGRLCERVRGLTSRLQSTEVSNETFGVDLTEAREFAHSLRKEAEDLRGRLSDAQNHMAHLRPEVKQQRAANKDLTATMASIRAKIKASNREFKAAAKELRLAKEALQKITGEATLVSSRVRQWYFKPANGG